ELLLLGIRKLREARQQRISEVVSSSPPLPHAREFEVVRCGWEAALAADFAGLLAWRWRCSLPSHNAKCVAVAGELTFQCDRRAIDSALQSRGGDGLCMLAAFPAANMPVFPCTKSAVNRRGPIDRGPLLGYAMSRPWPRVEVDK